MEAVKAELARSAKLQSGIWALAVSSTREAGMVRAPLLLLLACSLFAGYDMAIRRRLNALHASAFAVVSSVTAYDLHCKTALTKNPKLVSDRLRYMVVAAVNSCR